MQKNANGCRRHSLNTTSGLQCAVNWCVSKIASWCLGKHTPQHHSMAKSVFWIRSSYGSGNNYAMAGMSLLENSLCPQSYATFYSQWVVILCDGRVGTWEGSVSCATWWCEVCSPDVCIHKSQMRARTQQIKIKLTLAIHFSSKSYDWRKSEWRV